MADRPGLMRSSAVISAGVALSRLTGFLRTVLLVHVLADQALADVYTFSNNVPNIVYELVAGGVLSAVLLPMFVDLLRTDDREATSAVVTVAVGGLAALTVAGVLAAPALGWAIAELSGGSDRAAQEEALVLLLRWFIPQIFFYGVITVTTALLQARRRFGAVAFAPVLNNLVVIGAYLAAQRASDVELSEVPLRQALDQPVALTILGLGTTAGVVVNAVVLLPFVRRARIHVGFRLSLSHPALRRLGTLSKGALGYVLVSQVGVVATSLLANRYRDDGGYAAYTYANLFFFVVYGLLAVSITTALGPELATAAQVGDRAGLRREWVRGLRLIVLLVAPASAGLAVIAGPLMRILPLSDDGAALTSTIFAWFCIGLVPFSVFQHTVRGYYAVSETSQPFRLAIVQYGVVVGLGVVASPLFGIPGLAAAYAIGFVVSAVVAFARFARRLGRIPVGEVRAVPRMAGAALGAATMMAATVTVLQWGSRSPSDVLVAVVAATVGVVAYPAYLWGFGAADDLGRLVAALRRAAGR
jgi:putative peptidoglycan lipid II flippase